VDQRARETALPKIQKPGIETPKFLDRSKARRAGHEQKRVNVDFPIWMIESLDREASRLGIARQSLIKMLIAKHLDKAS
jgi:predicted DNA binding CopG/RHH family protein